MTALRLAYAASAAYAPYGSDADEPRERLSAALEKQDYRRAIKEADAALQVEYLDVRTHVLKAYALEQLGDTAGAQWHRVAAARLVRSITDGATGTVDSPYVVISVAEEYAVLGMTGYARQQQALAECGAHPCDILEAVHRESGDTRVFYFDIAIPQRHLEQALGGK